MSPRRNDRQRPRRKAPLALVRLEDRAVPATFTVTNVGDNGGVDPAPGAKTGTLRQAIVDANANNNPGTVDVIRFTIAGAGVKTIALLDELTSLEEPVTIDGYTQSDAAENTLAVGSNAVLRIQIDGGATDADDDGLKIKSPNVTIRGLSLFGFHDGLTVVDFSDNGATDGTVVEGCWLGVRADGTAATQESPAGIFLRTGSNGRIGGPAPGQRNVITGFNNGINVAQKTGFLVQNNYMGVTPAGLATLGKGNNSGILLNNVADSRIGGANPGEGNVIGNSSGQDIRILNGTTGTVIEGNFLGVGANGSADVAGDGFGIFFGDGVSGNLVGGVASGVGNVIARHGKAGIAFDGGAGSGNTISGNRIFANGDIEIDLGNDGITPNDSGDSDFGPNGFLNFPTLSGADTDGRVFGTFVGVANRTYRFEYFFSSAFHPSGNGIAAAVLGFHDVTTDGSGLANLTFDSQTAIAKNSLVCATATDLTTGDTSEFGFVVGVSAPGGSVVGFAFDDVNENGTFDAGESALSGVTVFEDANANGQFDGAETKTLTAADGSYALAFAASGARRIRVQPPAGFLVTTVTPDVINLIGGNAPSLDFGLVFPNTVPTVSDVPNQSGPGTIGPVVVTVGDAESPATALALAGTSSNGTLFPAGSIFVSGTGADRSVFLVPAPGQTGTATITLTVTDPGGLSATDTFDVTVPSTNPPTPPTNTNPTISDVGNLSGDGILGPVAVTVGDAETAAGALSLVGVSSNPTLFPAGSIFVSGTAGDRTLLLVPAAGQTGTATITLTVTDAGGLAATDTFDVTVTPPPPPPTPPVNTNPIISDVGNQSGVGTIGPVTVTVGDAETAPQGLSVSGTSSFATLFPAGSIFVSGTGATRQVLLVPATGVTGTAVITLTVTDAGGLTASDTFTATVLPPLPPPPPANVPPQISDVGNVAVPFGGFSGVVPFFVSDSDAAATNLTVTAVSNNPALVANAGVVLAGTGTNRTFVISPNAGQTGTATVVLTVTDAAGGTATDTFDVTILAPAALPTPPTGVTVFESAGANAAGIQASVDAFRAAIGGGTTPGAAGSFGGVRREINWDGVPASKENPFPGDFFNTTSKRGVLLSTNGTGLAVSGAAGTAGFEFGNVTAQQWGPIEFSSFSSPKLFAPLGSNTYDVEFRVAGTQIPAGVNSFGVVFTDVDLANVSKLEFFDADGTLILTRDVLPTGVKSEGLSFLGVTLPAGGLAAKVRVTTGNAPIDSPFAFPPPDGVAVDDFIFSEPEALPAVAKTDLFAVGTGPGVEAQVNVFNNDASFRFALFPFPGFSGGVSVSTGDVSGDGFEDIAVGAGPGGGPHVRVFDGRTGAEIHSFFAYDPGFSGGVFVGLGDATGDLRADLVTGTGPGGGPHVKVFNGIDLAEIHSFFAYDPAFRGGVTVRLGDVSADGFADVVTGAGPGGGPHVRVFDGRTLADIQSFFAGDPNSRGGVFVGVADFLNAGRFVVTASANGRVFAPGYVEQDNAIPVPTSPGNTRVPVAAIRLDTGIIAILIGAAPGTRPTVRIVDGTSNFTIREFAPFGESFAGGVFVG